MKNESSKQAPKKALRKTDVMPRFFDVKGREITDGCIIWNPADKHPEQSVKLIDGELWFGAKGTTPNENNDWCKLDKRYGTEKFRLIVS